MCLFRIDIPSTLFHGLSSTTRIPFSSILALKKAFGDFHSLFLRPDALPDVNHFRGSLEYLTVFPFCYPLRMRSNITLSFTGQIYQIFERFHNSNN